MQRTKSAAVKLAVPKPVNLPSLRKVGIAATGAANGALSPKAQAS